MKKAITLVLSTILALACIASMLVLTTSAEAQTYPEPDTAKVVTSPTPAVMITVGETTTYLGKQPVFAEGTQNVTAFKDEVITSVACGSGSAAFDIATATLTLTNATGIVRIGSNWGGFAIKLIGENSVIGTANVIYRSKRAAFTNTVAEGSIVFIGDGSLSVEGTKPVVYNEGDEIIFADKVTVTIKGDGTGEVLHANTGAAGKNNIKVIDGASVTVNSPTAKEAGTVSISGGTARLEINTTGKFEVNAKTDASWKYAIYTPAIRMYNGQFNVNADSSANTGAVGAGMQIVSPAEGNNTYFVGGTVNFYTKASNGRTYNIYVKTGRDIIFAGNVVANFKIDSVAATSTWGSPSIDLNAPSTEFTSKFVIADGAVLNFDGGENVSIYSPIIKNTDDANKKIDIYIINGGTLNVRNCKTALFGYKGGTFNLVNANLDIIVTDKAFATAPATFTFDAERFEGFQMGATEAEAATAAKVATADYTVKVLKTSYAPLPETTVPADTSTTDPTPPTSDTMIIWFAAATVIGSAIAFIIIGAKKKISDR